MTLLYKKSRELQKVEEAVNDLEDYESEYPLNELVTRSGISQSAILKILKEYWIDADELPILHLDLTKEEENYLYS